MGPSRTSRSIPAASAFLSSIGAFLRSPLGLDECQARIVHQYRGRGRSLLLLLRETVFGNPGSPYARLMDHAGVSYEDVQELVVADGVEDALARLHQAGVYLTLDEFKGRHSIRRGSLEIHSSASDFDNDIQAPHFEVQTGGSRGPGRKLLVDLDLLTHEASYELCAAVQFGLIGRPRALWRPVPPGSAGIKALLKYAKVGMPARRWFSQNRPWSLSEWRHTLFTASTMVASRVARRPLVWPEHVPVSHAVVVARWLAETRRQQHSGIINTNAASAVRVCQAADAAGLDISGSFFRVGGEPYTAGKASVITRAGCQAVSNFSMAEVGRIASACSQPESLDDLHVALDKVALLGREVFPPGATVPVSGLFLTTLHPSTPKIMVNVELGDYGTLSHRSCGCLLDGLGQTLHLREVRSYEKLTAEGMHFIGSELLNLVEETLPAQFGGGAMDYQMVEDEQDGVSAVTLVVSLRVGAIDEERLKTLVIEKLGSTSAASRMMANRWREAATLRIARREPYVTSAGKILALHAQQGGRRSG